jgi:quercetin dioxygenase-like cupin family protein
MIGGAAAQNIFYSAPSNPVNLNGNADIEFSKIRVSTAQTSEARTHISNVQGTQQQPPLHIPNGVCVRMIDFAPGTESNLHRSLSLVIGTCCEGEMEFSLGSGEKRIMRPGDVSINRAAMHKWRNLSNEKSARMLYILLDVEPVIVNGKALDFDMGYLMKEYADYAENEGANKPGANKDA